MEGDLLSLQGGLFFSQKGYRKGGSYHLRINYIDLPIHAKYSFDLNEEIKFFVFLGPYFAFGINHKSVDKENKVTYKYKWKEKYYRRFDLGPNIGIGARYDQFELSLGYQRGLISISPNSPIFNRTLGISLTYLLPYQED